MRVSACCAALARAALLLSLSAWSWAAFGESASTGSASARLRGSVLLAADRVGTTLVVVGERGIILLSSDEGSTWHRAVVPVDVTLTGVFFADADHGWAVGHGGVVLRSGDGGETWRVQLDGVKAAAIELAAARVESTAGVDGTRRLRDAERLVAEGPDKPFFDVRFFDADHGLVVGAYGLIFATSDGGDTWRSLMDRLPNEKSKHLYAVARADGVIYIVGEQGIVVRSADRGEHFEAVATPYLGSYFGMVSTDDGTLVLFGLKGNAFRSVDHGQSWQKLALGFFSSSRLDGNCRTARSFWSTRRDMSSGARMALRSGP